MQIVLKCMCVCVFIYIYTQNNYTQHTHILCKLLFWIVINRCRALASGYIFNKDYLLFILHSRDHILSVNCESPEV